MNLRFLSPFSWGCISSFLCVSAVCGAYVEDADNDTVATADSVTPLQTPDGSGFFTATMTGSFSSGSDSDYWSFNAEAGDEISAWIEMSVSGTYPRLRLVKDNGTDAGTVLRYEQYGASSYSAFQNYVIPAPGTYYVLTYPYYEVLPAVDYTLRLDVGRGRQLESEDNNYLSQADDVIWTPSGVSIKARLAGALYQNVDYYDLGHLNVGNAMTLNMSFPSGSSLDASEVSFEIQNGSGAVLYSSTQSAFAYDIATNTVHYLKVSSSDPGVLAQYVLDLTVLDAGAPQIQGDSLPVSGTTNTAIIDRFTVDFSEYMNLYSVTSPASWVLIADGGDDVWGNDNDETYSLNPDYSENTLSATVYLTDGPLQPDQNVRLSVSTALADRVGNSMGSAYVREFRIENIEPFICETRNNSSITTGTPLGTVSNVVDGSYSSAQTISVGDCPYDVISADLDGDSNEDLISCNYYGGSISILHGNGDGTFNLETNLTVGSNPRQAVLGHFNGDAYWDLAVANEYSHDLSIFAGENGGGFTFQTNLPTGSYPRDVEVGDLNGDGAADLVVASYGSSRLWIHYGDNSGVFDVSTNLVTGSNPVGVSLADLNKDGHTDVAVANMSSDTVSVFLNRGDGTLGGAVHYAVGDGPYGLDVADYDQDGHLDLAVVNDYSDSVSILLGIGDGTFESAVSYSGCDGPYDVVSADINGDGALDLAVASYNGNRLNFFENQGDGTFELSALYQSIYYYPSSIAVGDFNGDGTDDFAVANSYYDRVEVFAANPLISLPEDPAGLGLEFAAGRGLLTDYNDTDYWVFSGKAGDRVTVACDVPGNPSGCGLYYRLLGPSGSQLTYFYSDYRGYGQSSEVTLPSDGRYSVVVSYNYSYWAEYRVRVSKVSALQFESENNNTTADADLVAFSAGADGLDANLCGYIGTADTSGDYFSLGNLTSGMVVNVSLKVPSSSDLLPETYLLDPEGYPIAFSDNKVLLLGGTSADYGIVNSFSNFPATTFTAEFWMRSSDTSKYGTPISYARAGQDNECMLFDYRGFDPHVGGYSYDSGVAGNSGRWTHIAWSWDSVTGTSIMYKNGAPVHTNTNFRTAYSMVQNGAFVVGQEQDGVGTTFDTGQAFLGELDNLAIWNVVRTPSEIQSDLAAGQSGTESGLVGYWDFEDGTADDLTSLGNDLALFGNCTVEKADRFADPENPATYTTQFQYTIVSDGLCYVRVRDALGEGDLMRQYLLDINMKDTVIPYVVSTSLPSQGTNSTVLVDRFTVDFSEEMDAGTVTNSANYELRSAGPDGVLDTSDDELYTLVPDYTSGLQATLVISDGPIQSGIVRFIAKTGLRDRSSNPISAEYVCQFTLSNLEGYTLENRNNGSFASATPLGNVVAGETDGSFIAGNRFAVGDAPYAIAVADFNGDGHVDFATADYYSNGATVQLGRGDGSFLLSTNIYTGSYPVGIEAGLINNDAFPDLVVLNRNSDSATILLGDGTGAFSVFTNLYVGDAPRDVALADMNNDGTLDVIVCCEYGDSAGILLGNGDGNFSTVHQQYCGDAPYAVSVGDLDGNGTNDVAVCNYYSDDLGVLLGNGDGTMQPVVSYAAGTEPRSLVIADVNQDDLLDVVVGNFSNDDITLFTGTGGGAVTNVGTWAVGNGPWGDITVRDLTGDGRPDLAMTLYYDHRFAIVSQDENGAFNSVASYSTEGSYSYPIDAAPGDFDEDGLLDFAVANYGDDEVLIIHGSQLQVLPGIVDGVNVSGGRGRGNIADMSDYDYWSFSGEAGDQAIVVLSLPGHPNNSGLRFEVYRPDGTSLGSYYGNSTGGSAQSPALTLPTTGRYTVRVWYNYQYWGEYRIAVQCAHPPASVESENNDSTGNATSPTFALRNGRQTADASGFSLYNTGYDYYNLGNLASGTVVQASIDFPAYCESELYLQVLDSGGTMIPLLNTNIHNGVLDLDGDSDYLRTTTTNFSSRTGTVEGWVYPREAYDWGFWQTHDEAYYNWSDWLSMFSYTDGTFYFRSGSGSSDVTFNTQSYIPSYLWTHLAFTWEGTTMKAYVNGTLVASKSNATLQDVMDPFACLGLGHQRWLNGWMDEMRVWNRALSATEVEQAKAQTLNGNESGLVGYWDFESDSLDRSGSGNDGDLMGDAALMNVGSSPYIPATNISYITTAGGTYYVRVNQGSGSVDDQYVLHLSTYDSTIPIITSETLPTSGSSIESIVNSFTVTFSEEMMAASVTNPANYTLSMAGADDLFGTTDDEAYTLSIDYSGGLSATFDVPNGPLQPGLTRFVAGTNVIDRTGTSLMAYTNTFRIVNADRFVYESQDNDSADTAVNLNRVTTNLLDGTFCVAGTTALAGNPVGMAAGCFNSDTNLDVAVVDMSADTLRVLLGNGDNTFTLSTNMVVADGPTAVAVGFINNDAVQDLAVSCFYNDSVAVLLGNGAGGFTNATWYSAGDGPRNLTLGDLNQDGVLDIAVANEYGDNVGILLGQSNGTFSAVSYAAIGDGPYDVAIGDFDADGTNDLAAISRYDDALWILRGQGDGSFLSLTNLVVGDDPRSLDAADFNLDGLMDLACGNFGSDNVSVILSSGGGQFSVARTIWAGDAPHLTVQDVNGDSVPDLLTANEYSDSVSLLIGDGFGVFSDPVVSSAGDGPVQVLAGNFDGQSGTELAVLNKNENTLMILTPNGTERIADGSSDGLVRVQYGRGVLHNASDVDYWTFDGQAGDQLSIAVDFPYGHSEYSSRLYWSIYRPDGVQVVNYYVNDSYGYGQTPTVTLPVSGDYLLVVQPYYNYFGEYRFRLASVTSPVTLESESNNNTDAADVPTYTLTPGVRQARLVGLVHGNDTSGDYFKLGNLGVGTEISLKVEWPEGSTLSPALSIYGPSGEAVSLSPATNLVFNTVTNGTYYARISDAASTRGFEAQYQLNIALSDASAPEITDDSLPAEGAEVDTIVSTFTLEFSEAMDPAAATNAANYTLMGAGADGVLDTEDDEVYPLNPVLDSDGAGVSMSIELPPIQPGLTRFTASTALKDLLGNRLSSKYVRSFTIMEEENGSAEGRYNDSTATATPIELIESPEGLRTGNGRGALLDNSDVDYFSFTATNGETVVLGADVETYAYYHRLRFSLVDTNDTVLTELITPVSMNRGQTAPYVIPAAGTYYVKVSYIDDYYGEYQIHILAAMNPLTLETEENGTIASAAAMPMVVSATNAVGSMAGYIASNSDNDYYAIGTVTNDQTILVGVRTPDNSSLVPVVSVYNASGSYQTEVGTTGDGSAEVRIDSIDTYYVVVRAGENTGGLGKDYILDVEVLPTSAVVIPNLSVTQISLPSGAGIQSGESVDLSYQVQNTGSAPTTEGSWFDRVVLSSNKVMGDADDYSLGTFAHVGNLNVGESYVSPQTVTLPDGISGSYYLVVYTDFGDLVNERLFEGDNISASDSTFAVALADYPDLVVENLQVSGSNEVGQVISVDWITANRGALATSGVIHEQLRILRADNGYELYRQDITVPALAVDESYTNSLNYTTVQAVPHQIVVTTDYGDDYFEYNAVSHASAEQNSQSATKSIYRYYTVNVSAKPIVGGQVNGGGRYPGGTVITVTAEANTNDLPYAFFNWTEYSSFRNGSANYAFMLQRNVNLTANFGLPQFTMEAVRVPSAGGSVTGAGTFDYATENVLHAYANPGYAFDHWQEGETLRGASATVTNVLYGNRVMTAYFRELNPTHTVTTASAPAGVASVSGAGYYTNGNSVVFAAPMMSTNGANRYLFQQLELNGSVLARTNEYLNVFTTLQPSNMNVVARYTAQPLVPQVLTVKRNLKDPVPATTNFNASLIFDRSMRTDIAPQVTFTNMTASELTFDVPTNGTWSSTYEDNDTYALSTLSFGAGDDGHYGVLVSRATDLYGSDVQETNAATIVVNSTPPDNPAFAVVSSNAVSVTLGWSSYVPPSDLSGYRLYRETNAFTSVAGLSPVGFASASSLNGVIGGIELDKTFYVAVAAVDVAGNRDPAVTSKVARVDSVIPPPVAFTSTTIGASGAHLSWSSYDTSSLFGLQGYRIYWQQSDFSDVSGLTPYATVSAAQKSIRISGIDRTKDHYFAVVAYNRIGQFDSSVSTVLWQDPYSGTIDYDLTIGTGGETTAAYDIYHDMTVSGGAELTLDPGVTLRFRNGTGLFVEQGTLTALGTAFRPIVLTSVNAAPQPGDWSGLYLGAGADASDLAHVWIEYGQGLVVEDCSPGVDALSTRYNTYAGISLEGAASLTTSDLLAQYNEVGLQAMDQAALSVSHSMVMNNGTNVFANSLNTLNAPNVWWGAADSAVITAGWVGRYDASLPLLTEPLLTPAADTLDGVRDVGVRTVDMRYACRTAESMRVSEDSTFASVFFSDFASSNSVLLSEGGGLKTLYVQYRNVNGETNAPIAVAINYITAGPTINAFNLTEGATLERPFIVTCAASSPLGVAASEFYVDDELVASTNAAAMNVLWDVRDEVAGIHRVKYVARDTHGEFSVRELNVRVAPAPPPMPSISSPTNGHVTAETSVLVSGSAEPFISVRLVRNGAVMGVVQADSSGAFSMTVNLVEGANNLVATAYDDLGDAMSSMVRVVCDTGLPEALILETPTFSVTDGVALRWRYSETGERASSFRVCWDSVPFSNAVDAASSGNVVYGMNYSVRGLADGTYYFGVVGYDGAGNAGPLSNVESVSYDTTAPSFTIGYNKSSPVGPGLLHMVVTSSERLSGKPDLLVLPYGASGPTPLVVSNTAPNTFEADYNITALTLSGPAQVRLSASDIYGNPFSGTPDGVDLVIDTTPPSGVIESVPVSPVQILSNTMVQVKLALTEPPMPGTVPQLTLDPPAGATVNVTMSGNGTNWTGTVSLSPLMGNGFCSYSLLVRDALGNIGSTITSGGLLEIYNTEYPEPPDAPRLLNPVAQKGGYIHLIWYPVDNAETYSLYRMPGDSGTPSTIVTAGIVTNSIDDLPPADGNYRYAVSAERRGAESGLSTVYTKYSDRTPPDAPTNLKVQLQSSGVQITWSAPEEGEAPIRYNVYRNGSRISSPYIPTPTTDYPPRGTSSYHVASVDWLGNEASSTTNEFTMLVPAVSSFTVLMNEDQSPLLSWTTGDGSIAGVNLYRNGIKLNSTPLTATSYQDNAYSGSSLVEYSVKSVDSEGVEGPARVAEVYRLGMGLSVNRSGAGLPIINYFDRYEVAVTNRTFSSTFPVESVEIRRTYSGGDAVAVTVQTNQTLAANAVGTVVLPMSGMKSATAQSARVRLMQEAGLTGAQVVYQRMYSFASATSPNPMVSVTVTNSVVAGTRNNFKVRVHNPSRMDMDVVASRRNGAQDGDVYLSVLNALGQEITRVQYRGPLPNTMLTSDGTAYVTVPAGGHLDVPFNDVLIPESLAEDGEVSLRGGVSMIYSLIGTANQQISGPLSGIETFSLVQSVYYGTANTAKDSYANDEAIVITGQALRRTDDTPLANTPLHIGFAIGEYRWFEDLVTDETGAYSLAYEVPDGISGELAIWAAHPDVVDRIDQVTVGIYRMYVLPRFGDVRMSKNDTFNFKLSLLNPGAVALEGLDAEVNFYRMEGTNKIAISSLTATPQFSSLTLNPEGRLSVPVQLHADIDAPDNVVAEVRFFSSVQGAADTFTGNLTLLEAVPVLSIVEPSAGYVDMTVNRGRSAMRTVTVVNKGVRDLTGVTMSPASTYGWMQPMLQADSDGVVHLPDLPVGSSNTFDVVFAPPEDTAMERYSDNFVISGTNYTASTFNVPLYATVSSADRGDVQFYVQNSLSLPVPGATVRLRNRLLGTELDPMKTGTNGVLMVESLPEGLWYWQVSAPGHSTQAGSVDVIPAQTVEVETRLVKSVVTVNFSVVPVPFTDRYEIVIEQTFETHVPAPVLVLTPSFQRFSDVEPGFNARYTLTAKNHGLIRLNDVEIVGQMYDWGGVTPLIEYLPSLDPFEEVEIPVQAQYWGESGLDGQSERNSYSSCVGDMFGAIDNFAANLLNVLNRLSGRYNCVNSLDWLKAKANSPTWFEKKVAEKVVEKVAEHMTPTWVMKAAALVGCSFADDGGSDHYEPGTGGTEYSSSAPACFDPSTRVLLASGETVTIDQLAVGDQVKSGVEDHEIATVAEVIRGTASHWIRITLEDDPEDGLLVTAEHLVWVDATDKGWTAAQNLAVGDTVVTFSGARVKVAGIETMNEERPLVTVRLRGDIALFANGVLVHDQCGWWAPSKTTEETMEVAP